MENIMTMRELWMMYHGVLLSNDENGLPQYQRIDEPEEVQEMFIPPRLNSDIEASKALNILDSLHAEETTIGGTWGFDYVAMDAVHFLPKAEWTNPWRLPYVIADIFKNSKEDWKFFKDRLGDSIYVLPNVLMVGFKDHFDVYFTSDKGSMKVGEVQFTLTSWKGYVDLFETTDGLSTRYDNEFPGIRIENSEVYLTIDPFGNKVEALIRVDS